MFSLVSYFISLYALYDMKDFEAYWQQVTSCSDVIRSFLTNFINSLIIHFRFIFIAVERKCWGWLLLLSSNHVHDALFHLARAGSYSIAIDLQYQRLLYPPCRKFLSRTCAPFELKFYISAYRHNEYCWLINFKALTVVASTPWKKYIYNTYLNRGAENDSRHQNQKHRLQAADRQQQPAIVNCYQVVKCLGFCTQKHTCIAATKAHW